MKRLWVILAGVMRYLVTGLYFAGAVFVWMYFVHVSPAALADLGLIVYTFPVVAIGTYLLGLDFPYVSGSYVESRAFVFWSSVVFLGFVIFHFCGALQELLQPSASKLPRWKRIFIVLARAIRRVIGNRSE